VNDTFWGLVVVALAISGGARGIYLALTAIAARLEARNTVLATIGRGARVAALGGDSAKKL
jgi:hypothetical protein